MRIRAHVRNGAIVLDEGRALPEGAELIIVCDAAHMADDALEGKCVVLPLVHSERPGALRLTGEGVAHALEDEDLAS